MYFEKKAAKKVLMEQIQMFEMLLGDKTGQEIAYKRMHSINQLTREIDQFIALHKKQSIKDMVIDEYLQICKKFKGIYNNLARILV